MNLLLFSLFRCCWRCRCSAAWSGSALPAAPAATRSAGRGPAALRATPAADRGGGGTARDPRPHRRTQPPAGRCAPPSSQRRLTTTPPRMRSRTPLAGLRTLPRSLRSEVPRPRPRPAASQSRRQHLDGADPAPRPPRQRRALLGSPGQPRTLANVLSELARAGQCRIELSLHQEAVHVMGIDLWLKAMVGNGGQRHCATGGGRNHVESRQHAVLRVRDNAERP